MKLQIGQTIKAMRKQRKMSQEQLAEATQCSCKTISNIENGHIPELKQVVNICDVLKISMDDLFNLHYKPSNDTESSDGYFTNRVHSDTALTTEQIQDLETITQKLPTLTADQLKALRLLINLW